MKLKIKEIRNKEGNLVYRVDLDPKWNKDQIERFINILKIWMVENNVSRRKSI